LLSLKTKIKKTLRRKIRPIPTQPNAPQPNSAKPAAVTKPTPATPAPNVAATVPAVQPLPQDAHHPLIDGSSSTIAANQTPTFSPAGTIAGPLPEHQQYFERLIDEANAKNHFSREQTLKNLLIVKSILMI
jgi:hypothetical protein